jgi:hypothetical protein
VRFLLVELKRGLEQLALRLEEADALIVKTAQENRGLIRATTLRCLNG